MYSYCISIQLLLLFYQSAGTDYQVPILVSIQLLLLFYPHFYWFLILLYHEISSKNQDFLIFYQPNQECAVYAYKIPQMLINSEIIAFLFQIAPGKIIESIAPRSLVFLHQMYPHQIHCHSSIL